MEYTKTVIQIIRKIIVLLSVIPMMFVWVACGTTAPDPTQAPPTALPITEAPEVKEVSDSGAEANDTAITANETLYILDTTASTLTWVGSKPIGDSRSGTVQLSEGELRGNGNNFVSGSFTIDMTTIEEEDNTTRLEHHLKSDDFFDVENHPTALLEIISATPTDDGYDIRANLTIKEITNEITFAAMANLVDGTLNGSADIVFDRSRWDVRYGSGSFFDNLGDDLINDEIELHIVIVANSQVTLGFRIE